MTLSEFLSSYGGSPKEAPRVYAHIEEWVRFRAPSGMKTAPAEEAQHRARHAQAGKDKHWWEIYVGAYRSRRPARRDPVGEIHVLGVSESNPKPLTFATKAEAQSVADQIKRGEISVMGIETGRPYLGAGAKRGAGSLSKGETFAVGDRIKHRREFLRSIAWYTGVPRYGTVRAVTSLGKRALLEVDWSDGHTSKIISPNVTHASRVELV